MAKKLIIVKNLLIRINNLKLVNVQVQALQGLNAENHWKLEEKRIKLHGTDDFYRL